MKFNLFTLYRLILLIFFLKGLFSLNVSKMQTEHNNRLRYEHKIRQIEERRQNEERQLLVELKHHKNITGKIIKDVKPRKLKERHKKNSVLIKFEPFHEEKKVNKKDGNEFFVSKRHKKMRMNKQERELYSLPSVHEFMDSQMGVF